MSYEARAQVDIPTNSIYTSSNSRIPSKGFISQKIETFLQNVAFLSVNIICTGVLTFFYLSLAKFALYGSRSRVEGYDGRVLLFRQIHEKYPQ